MIHRVCTGGGEGMLSYFQRVGRTLFAPNAGPANRLERLFEQEATEFGLASAFLSRIDLTNDTQHFEVVHGSREGLRTGTSIPLSHSYCRKTIASPEGTMAIDDAVGDGWEGDPAYETLELGSYLGTTISVDDELYGTLCFTDATVRAEPFVDGEKALVELFGRWVGYVLALQDEPLVEGGGVSTPSRGGGSPRTESTR